LPAQQDGKRQQSAIKGSAVEAGAGATLVAVEGSTTINLALRSGKLIGLSAGLAEIELELAYSRLISHDILDLLAVLSWQNNFSGSPVYYFLGGLAGWRQEWIGSYKQARSPVGATIGIKVLLSNMAGFRFEYRPQFVLNDPQKNFTEHRLIFGISLFFRNN
jgi:hypothetical protein